ncbi:hypothetical protein [Zooshikella ganghwensis]|uniref:Uncharacterized protein n=1 Tax=Zooshikella ganghwensis TaxID=202772 RepID=A0A4P9VQN8_9GAMM|nr:hypothetical protein [Zooshikella ganghwensis]RDH45865.1 hypothetical protein B9G39_21760 [Zooshikella ganghwensis]
MKPMASPIHSTAALEVHQIKRRNQTEAELVWDKIASDSQLKREVNTALWLRLRYLLRKTYRKLLIEPAGY